MATICESPVRSRLQRPSEITVEQIQQLTNQAAQLKAKAMELTDRWGGAMFIIDRDLVWFGWNFDRRGQAVRRVQRYGACLPGFS